MYFKCDLRKFRKQSIYMKKYLLQFFILCSVSISAQQINVAKIKTHIKFLANDKLKGRGTATQQELTAANYIAKQFKSYGIEPKGNISSYYYSFKFKKPKDAHDTVGSEMVSSIDVVG